jgi:hypothetical protein
MSNEQDPKNQQNVENEQQPSDELTAEELDEVVGGRGADPVVYMEIKLKEVIISG